MTGLEIGLLVFGVLCFGGSFLLAEKLTSSDISSIEKMSEKEVNVIVEKRLREAGATIDKTIESRTNKALSGFERHTDKVISDQIYSISDHADAVKASIDTAFDAMKKTEEESTFLYNMLNEKQEKVTEMVRQLEVLESNLRGMQVAVEDEIQRLKEEKIVYEPAPVQRVAEIPEPVENITLKKAFEAKLAMQAQSSPKPSQSADNINEKILALHREGFSDVEIAKRLGKGLGEIKLVLGLFDEDM